MRPFLPPMKPIPEGATKADRLQMYWEHIDLMVKYNPGSYLPIGVKRRWWNWKLEHPRTTPPEGVDQNG